MVLIIKLSYETSMQRSSQKWNEYNMDVTRGQLIN